MEQVWKDLNQSTMQQSNNPGIATRGLFEEILINRPQSVLPHQTLTDENVNDEQVEVEVEDEDDKNEIFKKEILMNSVVSTPGFIASLNSPFEALATNTVTASTSPASSLLNPSCFPITSGNKRPLPQFFHDVIDGESGVDRRHKRMIKNRESAARSRARRQAYTSELEREKAELKDENAMLRKQQEKLLLSAPADLPKKRNHNRSFTAPF